MKPVAASWPNKLPQQCRIAIVGEAPGDEETWLGAPFVGPSGIELRNQLLAAGIDATECLLTNVIDVQPPGNNLSAFCLRKEDLPDDYPIRLGPIVTSPSNFYLHPNFLYNGARLRNELAIARPNVVIALGATAVWALLGTTSIGQVRGVVHRTTTSVPYKCVPTWHPAAVVRQWRMRPVAVADLVKARVESASPNIIYSNAELWIEPTLADLDDFRRLHIRPGQLHSNDVETMRGEITCIGIAPTPSVAIVTPFRINPVKLKAADGSYFWSMSGNYWPSPGEERSAWQWNKSVIEADDTNILGQNHLYDIQYFLRHGIKPRHVTEDTMLAHHSLFSELKKDLGFLGSVYTNFPSWKQLGARHATEDKRDD